MTDEKPIRRGSPTPQQLPLVFAHEAAVSRDDLLISDPLSAAVSVVDSWPQWPSPIVILMGPVGSGKTHLASIWQQKSNAISIRPELGSDAVSSAAKGSVLFEDVDRHGFDETILFHVINSVREHGHTMLMTTRQWPMSWPVTLPDLRSRLKAATMVEIGEPDDELLAQVLVKLFSDRQLTVDDRIISYIVARMERSLDSAQNIVEQMDHLALARGIRISRSLAAEVLKLKASRTNLANS